MNKLYTILAKTDALASSFKQGLKDYIQFFKKSQGAFQGIKNTYTAAPDTIDEPKKRGTVIVASTVGEKLDWLVESSKEYIDALFAQEATNASGLPVANLIVDGQDWGQLSSLELLRLKSFLENGDLKGMYQSLPVRPDSVKWSKTESEDYAGRDGIYESEEFSYVNRTTEKEDYILPDPNLAQLSSGKQYSPQVAQKTTAVVLGEGTSQNFTGAWSHRQRATTLRRINVLHIAVVEALKRANDCETVQSGLTAERIFGYIHGE